MFDLTGKVALVTGAARGIGKVSARELAECGASVMLGDVDEATLAAAAAEFQADGLKAAYTYMNVTDNESIAAAVEKTAAAFGGIDIVVNSAGILGTLSIEDMQRDGEWNRVLDVNLSGTFFTCQAALPYLKKSKAGRIINISSLTGRNGGFAGSMSYAASKGGVIAITKGMARHLSPYAITVNAVCPGPTETDIIKGYTQEKIDLQLKNVLLKRFGKPEEIGAAVCYLASEEAGFVTGLMLDINGGAYFG